MCGCGLRPLQNQCAHTCVCGSESGCAVCVRATRKRVATHPLIITIHVNEILRCFDYYNFGTKEDGPAVVQQIFKIRTGRKLDVFLPGCWTFKSGFSPVWQDLSANLGVRSCLVRKLVCPVRSSPPTRQTPNPTNPVAGIS